MATEASTVTNHDFKGAQRMRVFFDRFRERAAPVDRWVRDEYKAHPMLVIGAAIGLGYVVARLLRRR